MTDRSREEYERIAKSFISIKNPTFARLRRPPMTLTIRLTEQSRRGGETFFTISLLSHKRKVLSVLQGEYPTQQKALTEATKLRKSLQSAETFKIEID